MKAFYNIIYPFPLYWTLGILAYIVFLMTFDWIYIAGIFFILIIGIANIHKVDSYFSYINLFGKRFLFQSSKSHLTGTCDEQMKDFCHTSKKTISKLPSGKYHTITHDTVLQRFQKFPGIEITRIKYVYNSDLFPEINHIMGKKCKKCTQKSSCRYIRPERRNFYYVKFKKDQ